MRPTVQVQRACCIVAEILGLGASQASPDCAKQSGETHAIGRATRRADIAKCKGVVRVLKTYGLNRQRLRYDLASLSQSRALERLVAIVEA